MGKLQISPARFRRGTGAPMAFPETGDSLDLDHGEFQLRNQQQLPFHRGNIHLDRLNTLGLHLDANRIRRSRLGANDDGEVSVEDEREPPRALLPSRMEPPAVVQERTLRHGEG